MYPIQSSNGSFRGKWSPYALEWIRCISIWSVTRIVHSIRVKKAKLYKISSKISVSAPPLTKDALFVPVASKPKRD